MGFILGSFKPQLNYRNLDILAQMQKRSWSRALTERGYGVRADQSCPMPPFLLRVLASFCLNLSKHLRGPQETLPLLPARCWGWEVTAPVLSEPGREQFPQGTRPVLRQQHPKWSGAGGQMDFHIPTELPSLGSFKPGSDGIYFILNLVFVFVFQVSHHHPAPSPRRPHTRSSLCQEVSAGTFVSFTPRGCPGQGRTFLRQGNRSLGPASGPLLPPPSLCFLCFFGTKEAENAAMGAQSFLLSSELGYGCPHRTTGSPALQLPLSRMRKYWICFVKGKKKLNK